MNFRRATPAIQDLPGFPTQIPSRTRFWLNQHALVQDARNGTLNPPDVLKMVGEMSFIFGCLVQTEDEVKKYPRSEEDMWPLYGLPVETVRNDVGVTVKTLKEKAWEFGEHQNWPPSSSGTMLTILAQGYDGIVTRRHLFRIPSYRTFQDLKAQILNHFHFQPNEEFTLYFELEGL